MEQTKTLVHLHIFKNAGSSLDKILSESFGDSFMTFDKDNPGATINCDEVAQILDRNNQINCLSSHQIRLPAPVTFSRVIFPIFFLRHPVERLQSCFHFERDVQKRFPEDMTMEQYTRSSLRNPNINAVINLQTATICDNRLMNGKMRDSINADVIRSAISTLNNNIASFGLVSHFDLSMELIRYNLQDHFPQLLNDENLITENTHENFSINREMKTDEKMLYVKQNLSKPTYVSLLEALEPDLIIYNEAKKIFQQRAGKMLTNLSMF